MSEHTPGPWRLSTVGAVPHAEITSDSGSIALVALGRKESQENARLIAAAPDLLAACELALYAFETRAVIDWGELERAIAKARGANNETP